MLNVSAWEVMLENYWDKQMIERICYRFALDFNRRSITVSDMRNHASAVQFPCDISTIASNYRTPDRLPGYDLEHV